jgi:hypothetical protein
MLQEKSYFGFGQQPLKWAPSKLPEKGIGFQVID